MADHNEVLVVIVMAILILIPIVAISTAWDNATDPSTDPNSGDMYDSGLPDYDYEAHNQVEPATPHEDVDLGPSSNPQVEAG